MSNKNEWKEIEETEKRIISNNIAEYGFDIEKYAKDNLNKETILRKKRINKKIKLILILLCIGTIYMQFASISREQKIKAREKIINEVNRISNENFIIVSEKTHFGGDGIYILQNINNPEFKTTAIFDKDEGISTDFVNRYNKYCFEKWSDEKKNKFKEYYHLEDSIDRNIKEKETFLNYYIYTEVTNYEEFISAVEDIIDYIEFSEKRDIVMGKYIIYKDQFIGIQWDRGMSNEEIRKQAIEKFNAI